MPAITLKDISLKDIPLSADLKAQRAWYFRAIPEVCVERPRLITRYAADNGLFEKDRISILEKARTYRFVLEHRRAVVRHRVGYQKTLSGTLEPFGVEDASPFAGATTSKFKGVLVYPEFLGLTLWPELATMHKRAANPYHIQPEEIDVLNFEVFPQWMEHNILEIGRTRCRAGSGGKEAPDLKLLERLVFFLASKPECISHTTPDFSRAIQEGLLAMIADANDCRASTNDDARREFYLALAEVMHGMVAYANRLSAEAALSAAKETNAARKKALAGIADIYARVPAQPARTFREGLTTVWLCWTAIHLENPNIGLSLGRLDQVLYDLYRNDIDSNRISVQEAVDLVGHLWLKIGDHVPCVPEAAEQLFGGAGSNQAITIGGVKADGSDAVNDLTYVMLRAIELMMLRDPNLNARWFSGVNPTGYLARLCDANINTCATPAIHHDQAVMKTLLAKGDTLQQARDYAVVGCVEPGSNGRCYGDSASILLNLTSVLELTLFNGRHRHLGDQLVSVETGNPADFKNFLQFQRAFETQARWIIGKAVAIDQLMLGVHKDFYPTPVLSAFFEGPMENGKDLIEGGAAINSAGVTVIGLADVADCLSAIQTHVFEQGALTFTELRAALESNFENNRPLQLLLSNEEKSPKFGNEDPVADQNVRWVVTLMDDIFGSSENGRGGNYRVGYWTMTNHSGFGRLMGAMPNGRKAGENFTSGITPVSAVTPFLSKVANSIAGVPAACLSSGAALNLKFMPEERSQMILNMVAAVEACFDDNGGKRDGALEVQFNITDRNKFIDAVKHPENHPELLVRVSGYTAYFKDLNPNMQKEIIDRTEYVLSTGRATVFPPYAL